MERKICFFIGHREAPENLRTRLDDSIGRHITEFGVSEFVMGHYGHFDAMAASAVRRAKERHPGISLVLLLPFYPVKGIKELASEYDATFYPPDMERIPKPLAIVRANEYMVRSSEFLICYDKGYVGNTRNLVELARRRETKGLLHIENLADGMED